MALHRFQLQNDGLTHIYCMEYPYSKRGSRLLQSFVSRSVMEKPWSQNFKLKHQYDAWTNLELNFKSKGRCYQSSVHRPEVTRTGQGHIHSFQLFSPLFCSLLCHFPPFLILQMQPLCICHLIKAGVIYDSYGISLIILIMIIANPYGMFPSFQAPCQGLTFITSFTPYSILFGYV